MLIGRPYETWSCPLNGPKSNVNMPMKNAICDFIVMLTLSGTYTQRRCKRLWIAWFFIDNKRQTTWRVRHSLFQPWQAWLHNEPGENCSGHFLMKSMALEALHNEPVENYSGHFLMESMTLEEQFSGWIVNNIIQIAITLTRRQQCNLKIFNNRTLQNN